MNGSIRFDSSSSFLACVFSAAVSSGRPDPDQLSRGEVRKRSHPEGWKGKSEQLQDPHRSHPKCSGIDWRGSERRPDIDHEGRNSWIAGESKQKQKENVSVGEKIIEIHHCCESFDPFIRLWIDMWT